MHIYLISSATIWSHRAFGKVEIDTSVTIQHRCRHGKRRSRYICDNTAPMWTCEKTESIHLRQYSTTLDIVKNEINASATIHHHFGHSEKRNQHICDNTAPIWACERTKLIHLRQYSATVYMGQGEINTSATIQCHCGHEKR
jgi:hypothetical protein